MIVIHHAEDNTEDAYLFSMAIKELYDNVHTPHFEDGTELMNSLNSKTITPDIIFLDINMPGKDGYECLKEIRSSERLRHLPVIIFSTTDNEKEISRMYEAGANLYVHKPNHFTQWKALIDTAILQCGRKKRLPEEFFLKG